MVSEVDDAGGRHALWFPRCLALWRCKALSPAAGRHHDRIVTYEALQPTGAAIPVRGFVPSARRPRLLSWIVRRTGEAQVGGRCTVYVALLDEGVEVWRPATVEQVGPGRFRLDGPVPEGESWQFPPGAVVRCEQRLLSEGTALVAVERCRA